MAALLNKPEKSSCKRISPADTSLKRTAGRPFRALVDPDLSPITLLDMLEKLTETVRGMTRLLPETEDVNPGLEDSE